MELQHPLEENPKILSKVLFSKENTENKINNYSMKSGKKKRNYNT